ncbi:MAG: DedA family protein [Streptosporangiales bacterium]|nr:DedA family protein [Streptosporangiales bacterium]
MALVTELLDWLQSLPPIGVTAGAGFLVFGECTLGLGFIAPGETGLFVLGAAADTPAKFAFMWLVTTVCAVLGDSVGYLIGKRIGPRLRRTRFVRNHGAGWDRATDLLRRRGAIAVLIAIFLPVLRTLVPAAAGTAGLPYRKFLPAVTVGAALWCALHIGLGSAAGEAARRAEQLAGTGGWLVVVGIVVVGVVIALVKRRKLAAVGTGGPEDPQESTPEPAGRR